MDRQVDSVIYTAFDDYDFQIPCVYRFVTADAEQPICKQYLSSRITN